MLDSRTLEPKTLLDPKIVPSRKMTAPALLRELLVMVPIFALFSMALLLIAATSLPAQEGGDDSSAVVGRGLYRSYCASCHGAKAQGDGSIAEYLRIPPADLTEIAARNGGVFPFAEVVEKIDGREAPKVHGSDMPVWGDALRKTEGGADEGKAHKKVEALAHYLSSIQVD